MLIFLVEWCFFSWFIPWNSKGQRSVFHWGTPFNGWPAFSPKAIDSQL